MTQQQDYTVGLIRPAPGFNKKRPGKDDFAFLKLEKTIDLSFSNHLSAACLPTCDKMFDSEFKNGTGTRCYVGGWGQDVETGEYVSKLKKVDVPIMDSGTCQERIRKAYAERKGLPLDDPKLNAIKIHE